MLPSAGQGIIALQSKEDDKRINAILKKVNHESTYQCAQAERNVLKVLEGIVKLQLEYIHLLVIKKLRLKLNFFLLMEKKDFLKNPQMKLTKLQN